MAVFRIWTNLLGRQRRRLAIAVTLAVAPGLVLTGVPTFAAPPAKPRPIALPATSPPLRLPEPSIPAAEGALSVPADWNARLSSRARRTEVNLPVRGNELVDRRDAVTKVFANADATETVVIHGEAIHYRMAGHQDWYPIDNRIVADAQRPGWVRNAANDWTARFGPITPGGGGGVELVTGAGVVRLTPEVAAGTAPIKPVVAADGAANTVMYSNVWPEVDVRFVVTGGRVRTEVIAAGTDRATFPFVADGLHRVRLTPPQVVRSGGAAAADSRVTDRSLTLSVDQQWLSARTAAVEPLVVTTAAVIGASTCTYSTAPWEVWCDGISTGTNRWPPAQHWWLRGVAQFNYRPWVETRDVLYAGVWMSQNGWSTADPELVNIWEATGWSFDHAVAGGNGLYWIDQEVVQDDNHCFGADVCFDVTEKMHNWQLAGAFNGWWDGKFGFSPEEDDYPGFLDRFSYKNFDTADVNLVLNVNARPPAPALAGPQDGALAIDTLTPTLRWSPVTDADGDAVKYTAKIATGPDGESGLVATSPETTGLEWTVPAGVLRDGLTYYWKVFANDTKAWTPSLVRKLTVDRRLGMGGTSPVDSFGGVTTNLVSGNVSLSVDGPDLATVGGGIDVDLVYNGRPALTGLRGTYREDLDRDQVVDPEDPVKLVRTDSQVSFAWGEGSPSPAVPADFFLVNWTGTVRTPAGNWQLGVRSDDGARVRVDGALVVDRWGGLTPTTVYQSGGFTGLHTVQVEYYEHSAPAYVELWIRNQANPSLEFIVPAHWLAPEAPDMPAGWSVHAADSGADYTSATVTEGSVSLITTDGSAMAFTKQADGGYKAPEGVDDVVNVNADGGVSVHDDAGLSYVFRPDGGLESVVSALDDRRPAAARNHYDGLGRLSRINDPVSGRDVTFRYAASDGDSACPNVPPLGSATNFQSEAGMLCRVSYWDGTATDLYYHRSTDLLAYIVEPGDMWWGFSYDTQGRLVALTDPVARDAAFTGARTDSDPSRLSTTITYTGDDMTSKVRTVTGPAALQTDTQRPQRTYTYVQTTTGGILINGSAIVARAGVSGTETVRYDHRGRETEKTNALGSTTRTHWDQRDLVIATETADGLLTATTHNVRNMPTDVWGPAPKAWFDKIWYGFDFFVPKPERVAQIPHEVTRYDEGLDGLDVRWWNNINRTGTVVAHQYNAGSVRESFPAGSVPEGVAADGISARFTGDLVFDAAGEYHLQLCAGPSDLATLSLDGHRLVDVWAVPDLRCGAPALPVRSLGANETHRIEMDFVDLSGDALLHLNWTKPNGVYEPVPPSALRPSYGLVTSTVDEDGKATRTEYVDAATGIGPQHGLVTRTTVDPGGLNLTETTTYEAAGGTGRFLRPLVRTRPSGAGSTTTNTYYGNTEQRDNPCTTTVDPANQGGLLKLDTSADPDGAGAGAPIVRELVYDKAGRVVAARSGSATLSAGDWICTTYDVRGRQTEVRYPAFGGEPARTVTHAYLVDPDGTGPRVASPLVNTTTDPAGTITTEDDLFDREVSYTDVFGNTTTVTYDLAGRAISSGGPAGTVVRGYDALDRVTSLTRNGAVLANGLSYDASNRLRTVTYPTGTGTAGNGTTGTFDYDLNSGHLRKVTWTGPGGALLTSDEVNARSLGGDVLGQVVDGVDHHAGNDYTYDRAGRLTDAWVPGGRYQYAFSASTSCTAPDSYRNTNRTRMTVTPTGGTATQTSYCYDHADRLTSVTGTVVGTITYDKHGNTTGIFGETRQYDVADRHVGTVKGTTAVRYLRDATDRIVERKVNGTTVARYGSTGTGDAPDFTTDAANRVLEVTLLLPGGVLLTTRTAGNVWSYPDSRGSIAAVANSSGVKQGATKAYDPFGGLVSGTLPDNSHGEFDYGWLGEHQRPLEHQPTLQPVIEMGGRQYSPLLGRFLEVDPVDGGSANDYEYCSGDSVNCTDLDGTWGIPKFAKKALKKVKKVAKKAMRSVKKVAKKTWKKASKFARKAMKKVSKRIGKIAFGAGRFLGPHLGKIARVGTRIARAATLWNTFRFQFVGCLAWRSIRDKDNSFRDSFRDMGGCAKGAVVNL